MISIIHLIDHKLLYHTQYLHVAAGCRRKLQLAFLRSGKALWKTQAKACAYKTCLQKVFETNKNLFRWVLLFLAAFVPIFYMAYLYQDPGSVIMASISSNGRYVITTQVIQDGVHTAVLWNIEKRTYKVISRNANIYSAYFIKHSDNFMWQDLKNIVHVQNIQGKEILKFSNFPVYGHVMSTDLKHYIASDIKWNLFKGHGANQKQFKFPEWASGFIGGGTIFHLALSRDDQRLLTSADGHGKDSTDNNYDSTWLWSIDTGKPIRQFPGNQCATFATASPNGRYVVAGDEDAFAFVWNAITGKRLFELNGLEGDRYVPPKNREDLTDLGIMDEKDHISTPKDFSDIFGHNYHYGTRVHSLKFIDQTHFLMFTHDIPYATLYDVSSPRTLKHIPLGRKLWPSVNEYYLDESIDTSPDVHILVTGQQYGNGIMVYHYDPQKQTLEKIWSSHIWNWKDLYYKDQEYEAGYPYIDPNDERKICNAREC